MTLDSQTAILSTGVHGVVAYVGTSIFCVVVEQPAWLPILCSILAASPSAYRVLQDRRLRNALAEVEKQRHRAEIAEARIVKESA